ncbi:MAG: hypothetical protein ACYDIE_03000 [Candidatus Krumholzibacteriia bacterium]
MHDTNRIGGGRCGGRRFGLLVARSALLALAVPACAGAAAGPAGEVLLTGVPAPGTHYYRLTTDFITVEPDGRRHRPDVYDVWIEYAVLPDGEALLTCRRFDLRPGEAAAVSIPALRDWSYRPRLTDSGLDEQGRIFGIDQAKFAGLADAHGAALSQGAAYCVFNSFVDFHSFTEVFARRADGGGIQDLRQAGQRIVHAASRREAPISLNDFAAPGSNFRLGEVTLALTGVLELDGQPCALIRYDSGDCALAMTLQPAPQVTLAVSGSSHFFGDLCVDLAAQTVRRADLAEFVVQETSGAVLPQPIRTVVERQLVLRDLPREEFARGVDGGGLEGKP